jgi:hypothetical protein
MLLDIAESGPQLARLLALVEPTKTTYGVLGHTPPPTKTLAQDAWRQGASESETHICGIAQPKTGGFSDHCSREIPDWQAFEQGGIPLHATEPLSR